jgi:gas vesicle protein
MKASFIIGTIAGLAAGVVVGILFAPEKGSETRRKISEKGGELSEELKNRFHQFGEFVTERLDSTRGIYSHFIRMGEARV